MEKLFVVKVGGHVIDDEAQLHSFLEAFSGIEGKKILVHGGGKLATRVAEGLGVPQQLIDGRRITDAETLKVITMVYAGFINKNIVAKLQALRCNAIGLTGADGSFINAHKRKHSTIDYGFVGDIDTVDSSFAQTLLQQDHSLVVAPLTADHYGSLLNTNADTIAQEIAKAMAGKYEVSLLYCFEKDGLLQDANDDNSVINEVNESQFKDMQEKQIVSSGMIPKLSNAFAALKSGVHSIRIGNAGQLRRLIEGTAGTAIKK